MSSLHNVAIGKMNAKKVSLFGKNKNTDYKETGGCMYFVLAAIPVGYLIYWCLNYK